MSRIRFKGMDGREYETPEALAEANESYKGRTSQLIEKHPKKYINENPEISGLEELSERKIETITRYLRTSTGFGAQPEEQGKSRNVVVSRDLGVLLPFGNPESYDHMLRTCEKQPVHDIVQFLQGNRLDTYLGGGIVEAYIFDPRTLEQRSDIDILSVMSDSFLTPEVIRKLEAQHIKIGKTWFEVQSPPKLYDRYMGLLSKYRFKLTSGQTNPTPRPIDLTLTDRYEFETSLEAKVEGE